jgi:hypothetical protein
MITRLERLKNTVRKYLADVRPDRLKTCQSERKSFVSRRQSVLWFSSAEHYTYTLLPTYYVLN